MKITEDAFERAKKIRLVIFDVDGTLYFQRPVRKEMALRLAGYYLTHPWRWKELLGIYYFRKLRETEAGRTASLEEQIRGAARRARMKQDERLKRAIQRWMFDGLIREHGVDVVLQGHEHAYARMTHHEADSTATTPVYTVSHCSPKNYRIEFNERFDKFGSGSRYYQKVRTSGDTLFLSATDAHTGTCYDSLFIVKKKGETRLMDCGKEIPEVITFTPNPNSKKDAAFAERIRAYKQRRNIK